MIENNVRKRIEAFYQSFLSESTLLFVDQLCSAILETITNHNKILICGNGGSASQASHLATELMVRYRTIRNRFPAISLASDGSVLTAISNDFSCEDIFSMQIDNLADPGDLLIAFSTSGNSVDIIRAIELAQEKSIKTFALLGSDGGIIKKYVPFCYIDKSYDTAIIQEHHLILVHLLCEALEESRLQKAP